MKKNIASIAKLTMNATMLAPRNVRERKKPKSTIGDGLAALDGRERAQRADRDREQRELARGAPVPFVALHERQHERRQADRQRQHAGHVHALGDGLVARLAHREQRHDRPPPTATGRFRKKIDCQLTLSTRKPPSTGPIASASADTPAHVPIALPRSAAGKALVMIDSVAGHHHRRAHALRRRARPPARCRWGRSRSRRSSRRTRPRPRGTSCAGRTGRRGARR